MATFKSDLSGREFPLSQRVSMRLIRNNILELVKKEHPKLLQKHYLAVSEVNHYRQKYLSSFLLKEVGELSKLEESVLNSINEHSILVGKHEESPLTTLGQHLADKVASFGGSWKFIITFGTVILCWICMNVFFLAGAGFDPYPFILLNLVLSCLAALQAPVIMMSQNRQEQKDREKGREGLYDQPEI